MNVDFFSLAILHKPRCVAYVLQNAKGFCLDLLDYLGSQAQYLHSLMSLKQQNHVQNHASNQSVNQSPSSDRLSNCEMALEALRNVIKANPGTSLIQFGFMRPVFNLQFG